MTNFAIPFVVIILGGIAYLVASRGKTPGVAAAIQGAMRPASSPSDTFIDEIDREARRLRGQAIFEAVARSQADRDIQSFAASVGSLAQKPASGPN